MEYLMTYGWALLVIVIVIAVLLYINPFRAPEQCIFDNAGLYCERPVLQVDGVSQINTPTQSILNQHVSGLLSASITNGERRTITITGIACARGTSRPNADMSTWNDDFRIDWDPNTNAGLGSAGGVDLAPQESLELRGFATNAGNPFAVRCLSVPNKVSGALDLGTGYAADNSNTKLRANEDFSGRIWIMYRYADEPIDAPSKIVGANLVTRAQ